MNTHFVLSEIQGLVRDPRKWEFTRDRALHSERSEPQIQDWDTGMSSKSQWNNLNAMILFLFTTMCILNFRLKTSVIQVRDNSSYFTHVMCSHTRFELP